MCVYVCVCFVVCDFKKMLMKVLEIEICKKGIMFLYISGVMLY